MECGFDHPYYIWNKRFLSIMGAWPEQPLILRIILPFCFTAFLMTIFIPEMIRINDVWGDITIMMDCITPPVVMLLSFTQLYNNAVNRKKFIKMLNHISSDWERFKNSPELRVIKKYASRGCKIVTTYSLCMYTACLFYLLMPTIPAFMDIVVPLNESRTKIYFFEAEYGLANNDDYYWWIIVHSYLTTFTAIIIIISNDVMYFMMVEHACALFEITGTNLQTFSRKISEGELNEDYNYRMICRCINLHREAIDFSCLIESSYSGSFIGVIGVCLLCLSLTGVQTVLSLDRPEQVLRYGSFCLAQVFHLYFNSVPGQKIMDYSTSIFEDAYSINWPDLTPKSQKLLMLIMMRSTRRCQITAGKIYIVSMESYSSVMQTSMSYFTFLTSML